MARGTQHRKRRTGANAGKGQPAAAVVAPRKQRPPQWQEQLFFQRLRVHAKWAFALLAVVFGLGFVFLGIGSGATGVTDALQNAFNFGGSAGGTSISSLEKKTTQHPFDAQAWRDLATAYESKQRTSEAISALTQYDSLRPKDTDGRAELASQYALQAQTASSDYQAAAADVSLATPVGALFAPAPNTPFGKAFSDPKALQDPIANTIQQAAQAKQNDAYSRYIDAQHHVEQTYQEIVKITPNDANAQLQLAQSAEAAQDRKVALAGYRAFLKLAPTDPLAGQVKQSIKTLAAQSK